MPAPIAWNRSPLPENRFAPLPLGAIRLQGALAEALKAERGGNDEERLCRAFLLGNEAEQHEAVARLKNIMADADDEKTLACARALMRVHGALNDVSVAQALLEALKRLYDSMEEAPSLGAEKTAYAADVVHAALWLYNLTGNKALLTLCLKLRAQGPDWTSLLHTFPQTRPVKEFLTQENPAYWRVDGQTIAAALRACGLRALYEGGMKNETAFHAAWKKLMRYHGAAHGLYNASPLLAGANPAGGVTSAAAEEMIRSLETLQWTLGAPECGNVMERIVQNALRVCGSVQQANQLAPREGGTPAALAVAASAMWMAARDGLAAFGYEPCSVKWVAEGMPIRVDVAKGDTFGKNVRLTVRVKRPVRFRLYLRIPAWAEAPTCAVNGEKTTVNADVFHVVEREWANGDTVELVLPASVRAVGGYHQSVSVVRGATTYALPVEPDTRWNMALLPERGFETDGDAVWAYACSVPEWTEVDALPVLPRVNAAHAEKIKLIPYGQTRARIAQFPAGAAE